MSVCLTVSNMVLYVSVTCGLRVVYVQVSDLEIWVCFVLLSVTTCVHPPTHTHTLATHTAAPPPHSASKAMVFQDKTSKSNPSLEAITYNVSEELSGRSLRCTAICGMICACSPRALFAACAPGALFAACSRPGTAVASESCSSNNPLPGGCMPRLLYRFIIPHGHIHCALSLALHCLCYLCWTCEDTI